MDQSLQVRKSIDQEIGRNISESLRRITIRYAAGLNTGVPASEHINGGVPDHPPSLAMAFSIGQDLKNSDRIGFFLIKAITIFAAEATTACWCPIRNIFSFEPWME